eukprot:Skav229670  [mRNA]  locus=scaffold4264:47587:57247:+ [translate_table: standard]
MPTNLPGALIRPMQGKRCRATWGNESRRDVACIALGSMLTLATTRAASSRSVTDFVNSPASVRPRSAAGTATELHKAVPAPWFGQMPIVAAVGTGAAAVDEDEDEDEGNTL